MGALAFDALTALLPRPLVDASLTEILFVKVRAFLSFYFELQSVFVTLIDDYFTTLIT